MVGTRILEKPVDNLSATLLDAGRYVCVEPAFQLAPSGQAVLAGKRVLNVAERGGRWSIRESSLETSASLSNIRAKLSEPALRFPLQILEGAPGRDLPGHAFLP
jgi:hypothetical protein